MIVVTGATGKLGGLVIESLLKTVPAQQIVAAVRDTTRAGHLAELGVAVRQADYAKPETLAAAFVGAEKILLISSNELGQRVKQHKAVIDASVAAKVGLFAYTSLLRADTSTLSLASEHLATEELIRSSGLPFTLLRNGWYQENHTESLGPAVEHGAILGAAQDGRFAAASRADYAAAAAAVLSGRGHDNTVYELAGDEAYTLSELAAEVSKAAGVAVRYQDLPQSEYEKALLGFGLPAPVAAMLADSDAGAARGELDSASHDLRSLLGRPTARLEAAVRFAIARA